VQADATIHVAVTRALLRVVGFDDAVIRVQKLHSENELLIGPGVCSVLLRAAAFATVRDTVDATRARALCGVLDLYHQHKVSHSSITTSSLGLMHCVLT
jgi:hypothetical protein